MTRGYHGTFLFLDYTPGLNYEIEGIPAWAIWFGVIAIHSDLVIYVKEYEEDFNKSQQLEIAYTSDRVQKKIVSIPHDELRWAKMEEFEFEGKIYLGEKGEMTQEEWYKMESEHADPFINNFVSSGFPKDRLIVIEENGSPSQYPLDFPVYN